MKIRNFTKKKNIVTRIHNFLERETLFMSTYLLVCSPTVWERTEKKNWIWLFLTDCFLRCFRRNFISEIRSRAISSIGRRTTAIVYLDQSVRIHRVKRNRLGLVILFDRGTYLYVIIIYCSCGSVRTFTVVTKIRPDERRK